MSGLKQFLFVTCILVFIVVSGCVVVPGGPVAVEVEEIEIGFPPPPPPPMVIVTRPPRPSRFHIWIEGHHVVRSGTWVWVKGHWTRPVRRGAAWVPSHTRRNGKVWIWRPGHWH
jgi:hypothetical protein